MDEGTLLNETTGIGFIYDEEEKNYIVDSKNMPKEVNEIMTKEKKDIKNFIENYIVQNIKELIKKSPRNLSCCDVTKSAATFSGAT